MKNSEIKPRVRICFDCTDLYPVQPDRYGNLPRGYTRCPHCCDEHPNTSWFHGTWVRDYRVRLDGMLLVQE